MAVFVLTDSPPSVCGFVHSSKATLRTPTTTRTVDVIRTTLEWTESLWVLPVVVEIDQHGITESS